MKKICVFAAAVLIMGLFCMACETGHDGNGNGGCPNIQGDYAVSKQITAISAEGGLTLTPGGTPLASTLKIEQLLCELLAMEDGKIPYLGKSEEGDTFYLEIESPDELAIELTVTTLAGDTTCKFKGYIDWDGDVLDSGDLSGYINYDLEKHADETKLACPGWITVDMDFEAAEQ